MSDLFYIVSLPQPKVTSSNISEIITSHLGKQAGLSGVPIRNNLIGEIRLGRFSVSVLIWISSRLTKDTQTSLHSKGSGHYIYITEQKFALDNWYNIEIEQKEVSGKVRIVLSPSIVHLLDNCMSGILHNYDWRRRSSPCWEHSAQDVPRCENFCLRQFPSCCWCSIQESCLGKS